MKNTKNSKKPDTPKSEKQKYNSPKVTTESLMVYGALCNGMSTTGGRKAVAPVHCTASKLNS